MNYDVDYFIKKFEAIPEDNWCVGDYKKYAKEQYCAYGHCGMHKGENKETTALGKIFEFGCQMNIIEINDGGDNRYKQHHPKQRILAALYDIKKMQQPEWNDITTELAKLPIEETSDLTIKTNIPC